MMTNDHAPSGRFVDVERSREGEESVGRSVGRSVTYSVGRPHHTVARARTTPSSSVHSSVEFTDGEHFNDEPIEVHF